LRRRDRHYSIRAFTGSRRWSDEAVTLQLLREQAHPLPIVPQRSAAARAASKVTKIDDVLTLRVASWAEPQGNPSR
jgi:hypothetical protein